MQQTAIDKITVLQLVLQITRWNVPRTFWRLIATERSTRELFSRKVQSHFTFKVWNSSEKWNNYIFCKKCFPLTATDSVLPYVLSSGHKSTMSLNRDSRVIAWHVHCSTRCDVCNEHIKSEWMGASFTDIVHDILDCWPRLTPWCVIMAPLWSIDQTLVKF